MKKPIVLVIMDGVGRGDGGPGDAVKQANTPTLDNLMATCPMTWLKAHGTAVGLPTDDDMGNSEVGHNALGCGQIYSQGAKLVQESIESGSLYQSKTWIDLTDNCLQNGKALHFIGLLSDGNVHSNISHLIAMLKKAREMGLKKVYCHILLDGRDVPATSALDYVDQLESVLAELNDAEHEYKIASGGGRMVITMDRYEANWPMVEKGWRTHVQAEGRQFASAREAIETYRAADGKARNFVHHPAGFRQRDGLLSGAALSWPQHAVNQVCLDELQVYGRSEHSCHYHDGLRRGNHAAEPAFA